MKYESKIQKINHLIRLFKNKKSLTTEEMIAALNVDKRTVQRYLAELRESYGFNIKYNKSEKKFELRDKIEEITFSLDNVSEREIEALELAVKFLSKKKNFPLIDELECLNKKIREKIFADEGLKFEITDYSIPVSLRDRYFIIKKAIDEGVYLIFKYFGSKEGRKIERKVAPWRVIYSRNRWYLIGHCKVRDELRIFNIAYMDELRKTDEYCTETLGLDFGKFRRDMFGPWKGRKAEWVTIYYKKDAARYIEKMYFPQDTKIKKIGDDLRLKIRVSYPEAVLFYLVLPFHYNAEVEKPKWLRDKMIKYLKKMLEMYEGEK